MAKYLAKAASATAWLLLAAGCSPTPLGDGERRVALKLATEQVILPTYAELAMQTSELKSSLEALAAEPSLETLAEARERFRAARVPLGESSAFGFGPAEELRSAPALDQQPIDPVKIEAELRGAVELTPEYVARIGANRRGLHGVEYLLFPAEDPAVEQALLADEESSVRRRTMLVSMAHVVAASAEELSAAWEPTGGDYGRRFSQPGGADSVAPDVQSGLDTLLNHAVFTSEVIANVKLGKPLGSETGGEIDPSAQESERSGASIADALASLRGVRNVYLGSREGRAAASLSTLVRGRSPAADQHAQSALREAEAALLAIPEPLTLALEEFPETVGAALEAVKTLKRVLATEVLGTLGASLKFNDNDGD